MSAELLIYGPIGSSMFEPGISAGQITRWLRELPKSTEEITVRLNSPGGDAFEGVAIYGALHRHPARVVIEVDAIAASAASIIAMAGDSIRMSSGAMIMIHEAWGITVGPAEDHSKQAELLSKLNAEMAEIYAARTKGKVAEILELMNEETWMAGAEAVKRGFADEAHAAKAAPVPEGKASAALLDRYKHTPRQMRAGHKPAGSAEDQGKRPRMLRTPSPLADLARAGASARLGDR